MSIVKKLWDDISGFDTKIFYNIKINFCEYPEGMLQWEKCIGFL